MESSIKKQSKIFLSKAGLQKFQNRLDQQYKTHADLCHQREVAHELSGDGWHDNPHFNYLQQMEANSTWKICELEEIINKATLYEVSEGQRPINRATLGSVVRIELENIKTSEIQTKTFELVGYQEGDPDNHQLSYDSPLGSVIMGLSIGDVEEITLSANCFVVEVMEMYSTKQNGFKKRSE